MPAAAHDGLQRPIECAVEIEGRRGLPGRAAEQDTIPGGGKASGAVPLAEAIGAFAGHADAPRSRGDRAGFGKRPEEIRLAHRRPPVLPVAQWNRREGGDGAAG